MLKGGKLVKLLTKKPVTVFLLLLFMFFVFLGGGELAEG